MTLFSLARRCALCPAAALGEKRKKQRSKTPSEAAEGIQRRTESMRFGKGGKSATAADDAQAAEEREAEQVAAEETTSE